jgi:hypothetical protein
MLGVDAETLGSVRVSHPGELQDRAARGVQDLLLDLFGVAMDAMALPTEQRDLRDRIHHAASGTPGQMRRFSPDRIESSRWLAPLISLLSIGLLASARTLASGTRAQRCPMLAGPPVSEATARRRAAQCRVLVGCGRAHARATVSNTGDAVVRGILLADAAESPSDQPDRAGKRGSPVSTDSGRTDDLPALMLGSRPAWPNQGRWR